MKSGHWTVYLAAVVVPLVLTYASVGHVDGRSLFALSCGVVAFCLMAANLLLAARLPLVEDAFGGLDQVYFMHKWSGISVLVLVLFHKYVGLNLPGQAANEEIGRQARDVAEFVFPILVTLLAASALKRLPRLPFEIPYAIWRLFHRILGLLFIALSFHQLAVKAPFIINAPIALYLVLVSVVGIASFVYAQVIGFLRPRRYEVTNVERHPGATIVSLKSLGRPIAPLPGCFAFVGFNASGLREAHPFTVSSVGRGGELEFSIRPLGDFTRRVRDRLKPGMLARVEGGYGEFDFRKGGRDQIWVAGGIGVTPFLAWADSLAPGDDFRVELHFCVRNRNEAVGIARLEAAATRCSGFRLALHESATEGRFTSATILDKAALDMSDVSFWFCGPAGLRKSLIEGFRKARKQPRSVHYERFEFR